MLAQINFAQGKGERGRKATLYKNLPGGRGRLANIKFCLKEGDRLAEIKIINHIKSLHGEGL